MFWRWAKRKQALREENVARCPSCGERAFPGDVFCGHCGLPLTTIPDESNSLEISDGNEMPKPVNELRPAIEERGKIQPTLWDDAEAVVSESQHSVERTLIEDTALSTSDSRQYGGESLGTLVEQGVQAPGAIVGREVASNVRTKLVVLTREEARVGCTKEIDLPEGGTATIRIPAGVNIDTKVDVPGMGGLDEITGEFGPLRLSFYLID